MIGEMSPAEGPGRMIAAMRFKRSDCPITNVLDTLGDKWTLLVIRDLVLGKRRYQEFLSSPEGIASNILANRLAKLEAAGLVTRRAYQENPPRHEYLLTKKGNGLEPVLEAIIVWGKKHYPGTKRFPTVWQGYGAVKQ
jgi:DNA-binding HxlR family transcriptional regulator